MHDDCTTTRVRRLERGLTSTERWGRRRLVLLQRSTASLSSGSACGNRWAALAYQHSKRSDFSLHSIPIRSLQLLQVAPRALGCSLGLRNCPQQVCKTEKLINSTSLTALRHLGDIIIDIRRRNASGAGTLWWSNFIGKPLECLKLAWSSSTHLPAKRLAEPLHKKLYVFTSRKEGPVPVVAVKN